VNSEMSSRCYYLLEDVQVLKNRGTDEEVSSGLVVRREEVVESGRFGSRSIVERNTVHSIWCVCYIVLIEAVCDY